MLEDHPVTREVIFSGSEGVAAVYVVLQLTVLFDRVGADPDHYQFEVFLLKGRLDLVGEFSLHVVIYPVVQEVQEDVVLPSFKQGIS